MTSRLLPFVCLIGMGCAWGLSMPMSKLAVSTGREHFGLIVWQIAIVALIMAVPLILRPRAISVGLRHWRLLLVVALFGTIISNSMSYLAAGQLPAGVMAIVMSLIPMSALPIALFWGAEQFNWRRLSGLVFGGIAMVVLIGPDTSLPNPAAAPFVLIAAIATVCYGFEGNYVSRFGLGGLDAIQVLFYSSILGLFIITPLALVTGQFYNPLNGYGIAENALIVSSVAHGTAYACYIWLVGRAGPVFAAQVSYVVTIAGIALSMILLGERYSGFIWLALGLVLIGLFLVQPKSQDSEQA
ncbi:MAG: DMT family transporter [Amylibacter sp.]